MYYKQLSLPRVALLVQIFRAVITCPKGVIEFSIQVSNTSSSNVLDMHFYSLKGPRGPYVTFTPLCGYS